MELQGVFRGLDVDFDPSKTLHLTPDQCGELVRAVNKTIQLQYWLLARLAMCKGVSKAMLYSVQDPNMVFRYATKGTSAIQAP